MGTKDTQNGCCGCPGWAGGGASANNTFRPDKLAIANELINLGMMGHLARLNIAGKKLHGANS
jgi:hypothetical protein